MKRPALPTLGILLALLFAAPSVTPVDAAGRPPYVGIWGIWGGEYLDTDVRPWLKGTLIFKCWDELEPANNQFEFGPLDSGLQRAADNGHPYIMIGIYAGFNSPDWLYTNGVPKVTTISHPTLNHPYYLDPDFKSYFKRMINTVAAHVKSYAPNIRNRIIGIQCPLGSSGDPHAYYGEPVDPQYDISTSEWEAYQKELFAVYCDAYSNTVPPIVPLLNPGGLTLHDWLETHYPRTWRKYSFAAHAYQHHKTFDGRQNTLIPEATQYVNGWPMLVRDEFTTQDAGWYKEAPIWNTYWTLIHALHWGIDFVNIPVTALREANSEALDGFRWYNTYAGTHDPLESQGAWLALRDGLDCADTKRFPESVYGELVYDTSGSWEGADGGANPDRYLNIANAFAAYGAIQGDNDVPTGVTESQWFNKMNDVAWKCPPGNFQMYLDQHDPLGTSRGWWRVGSTNQPFGRFARGFSHANGWDTMYFNVDDGLFRVRRAAGHTLQVRVVYFDQGIGKWRLEYDAVGNPQKTAYTVTKTDSGQWKEKIVTLTDAYLGNRCPHGTDLMLVSVDSEDDIFHMIEVSRTVTVGSEPTMPVDLTALAVGTSRVELSWRDRSDNEQNFKIRRGTDNITFGTALIAPANATNFVDTTAAPGTTYYYKVQAEHATAGDSGYAPAASATTAAVPGPFTACNDFAVPFAGGNVTTNTRGDRRLLLDVGSGRPVCALLAVSAGGGGPYAHQGGPPAAGTDADLVFAGRLDCHGLIGYAEGPLELTLTGLDPDLLYEWVLFGNRAEPSYADRYTTFRLAGAESFENQSTPGVTISTQADPEDTTRICNGDNTQNGYVARYAQIEPGPDGEIRMSVSDTTEKFYLNAMMLRAVDPPRLSVPIPKQATWKYEDSGTDLGSAWRAPGYDDSGWAGGSGPLGFGETYISTLVSYGSDPNDKHRTTYFRKRFTVDDAARSLEDMTLYVRYDDGFVAYLNGSEIARQAMPQGAVAYATFGYSHEAAAYEQMDVSAYRGLLNCGENVLAIEVHQAAANSSDLVLDAELTLVKGTTDLTAKTSVLKGAAWRYRKGSTEASSPKTAWRTRSFDDSAWAQGPTPIGYGAGPLGTTLPDMQNNYASVFLRRRFELAVHPLFVGELRFDIDYDDGFILWVNGSEVARVNALGAPGRFVPHDAPAAGNMRANWSAVLTGGDLPAVLVQGTNVLCAQVFNRALDSSDLLFDCELTVVEGSTLAHADDTDSDGIADGWELAMYGADGMADCLSADDPDGDGFSNLHEYIAGTDPLSETSCMTVHVTHENGLIVVRMPTCAGYGADKRCYRLEQLDLQLGAAGWTPVPGFERIVGQGQTIVHTNGYGYNAYAYRARVWIE